MAQKLEFLENPTSHGVSIPSDSRPSSFDPFIGLLKKHLTPGPLGLDDSLRSSRLRLAVALLLRYHPSDPIVLLRLLDVAQTADATSTKEVMALLSKFVKRTRSSWWQEESQAVEQLRVHEEPDKLIMMVDSMRATLLQLGIADAWDQTLVCAPVLFHRRRMNMHITSGLVSDRSATLELPAEYKLGNDDYVFSFINSSAVQYPADPVIYLQTLQALLLTAPSEQGQVYFDEALRNVPLLGQIWPPELRADLRKEIEGARWRDESMYLYARTLLRVRLKPYLGDLVDIWKGVFPYPAAIADRVLTHQERQERLHELGVTAKGKGRLSQRVKVISSTDTTPEGQLVDPPTKPSRPTTRGSFGLRNTGG